MTKKEIDAILENIELLASEVEAKNKRGSDRKK